MKTLLLLRHAKSSWKNEDIPDYDRPLSKRGQNDLPVIAEAIEQRELLPQLILYSTALRAAVTAQYMAQYFDIKHTLGVTELYAANAEVYEKSLADIHDMIDIAMVVGHNPAIENLFAQYGGQPIEKYPTCGCAALQFQTDSWKTLSLAPCSVVYFITPNSLKNGKK